MDAKFMNNPFAISWKKKLDAKRSLQVSDLDDKTLEFWSEKISTRNDPDVAIIDGNHYIIGGELNKGFGGRKFTIKFMDGRVVETCDLWHQGKIPESYREVLSDNAKFIYE